MQKWLGIGVLMGLVGGVSVAACSNSTTVPFPDQGSFCTAKAQAECQEAMNCSIDATNCQTVRAQACNDLANQLTQSGTRKYNPGNAQACIDAVKAAYNSANLKVAYMQLFGPGSIDDKCQRVFQGSADKDQSCTSDYDCINNRICAPVAPGATNFQCADPQMVAAMQPCANIGSVCATGTFCSQPTGQAALCQPRAAQGQACTDTQPCLETLTCAGGQCLAKQQVMQACASNDECAPSANYCDPYAGFCTVGQTFATGASDCAEFTGAPKVDAGGPPDTGSPDTGAPETGTTDGGGD